ncbi:DUF302 domain-containing protein [Pseudooceanicola onchidii]|uniref:DUF302 domain-containing protein n=1 Tax=Pseudooceanicola onchidii TaxID=2562279 RepID=UPI001F0F55F1|nr:DUF302 domain-containing protein [Pseudooceanicola onchidii]
MTTRRPFALALSLCLAATPGLARDMVTYTTDQSFDDVTFGLENAILDEGLVIDHVSHTGEMLERTRADVGSDVVIFDEADVYSFCSAKLSREVMEADWQNLMFCPYTIFVAVRHDTPDETIIGFRSYPEGEMQKIEALLDGIVKAAIGAE